MNQGELPLQIRALLSQARDALQTSSPTPDVDAFLLLGHVLQVDKTTLMAWPEREVKLSQQQQFLQLLAERVRGVPVAYLLGHRAFWTLDLVVTPDCLIPRPETELLVECALQLLPREAPCRVADVGTGSGAIILSLADERRNWELWAGDISSAALNVAKQNAARLGLTEVHWLEAAFLDGFPEDLAAVISNPPYIAEHDPHVSTGDCRFEPLSALISGPEGFDALFTIAERARAHLKPGGVLLLEHGATQSVLLQQRLVQLGYHSVTEYLDLAGLPRVVSGVR